MTTSTITHRPHHRPHHRVALFVAAAAAVATIAAGSVAFALARDGSTPAPHHSTSTGQSQAHHQFQYTTSGGHVMLGE